MKQGILNMHSSTSSQHGVQSAFQKLENGPAGGIEVIRLHHPTLDQMNSDFICGLCKSK
jgi:hypothetical protein